MESGRERVKTLSACVGDAMDVVAPSEAAARSGRPRFLMAVHRPARRSRWLALAVACVVVPAAAGAVILIRSSGAPAAVFVANGADGEVGALLASATHAVPLRFAEGSHIDLDPQGQMRVAEFGKTKARVQLHRGRAHLSIRKGHSRAWAVEAGPFAVNVTGTRFSVDWQPEENRMEVVLHEGSVVVTGACLGQGRRMRAPDRFVADCDQNTVGLPAAPEVRENEAAVQVVAPAVKRAVVQTPWQQFAKAGQYDDAVARAKMIGLPRIWGSASAADLLDLGDAARLAGDVQAAEQTLVALQRRFPKSPQGALASFHLGRLAFDKRENFDIAARHFARYISQDPSGSLVGDAWGRLLEARSRSRDTEAAANDAKAYLARFENGPYAGLARRLIQNAHP